MNIHEKMRIILPADTPILSTEKQAEIVNAVYKLEMWAERTGGSMFAPTIKANSAKKRAARAHLYRLLGIEG